MRLYLYTYTYVSRWIHSSITHPSHDHSKPERDSAIENDIVAHEATHGTSNRLVGGGTARCLQEMESKGLGEGWSDAFAEWTEQQGPTIIDFTMGRCVIDTS